MHLGLYICFALSGITMVVMYEETVGTMSHSEKIKAYPILFALGWFLGPYLAVVYATRGWYGLIDEIKMNL